MEKPNDQKLRQSAAEEVELELDKEKMRVDRAV